MLTLKRFCAFLALKHIVLGDTIASLLCAFIVVVMVSV